MKQLFRLQDDDMTPVKIQYHKYHDVIVNLQELNKIMKIAVSIYHSQGNPESVGDEAQHWALEKGETSACRAESCLIAMTSFGLWSPGFH